MTKFGNTNGKHTYKIPFQWKVFDTYEIQADSLAEAVEWAYAYLWKLYPTANPTYVEESMDFDAPDTKSLEAIIDYFENRRFIKPED